MKYFPWLVVAGLVVVILLQRSCHGDVRIPQTITIVERDTVYVTVERVVYSKPKPTNSIPPSVVPVMYEPSDDCDLLAEQYDVLVDEHLSTNIYEDTVRSDSSFVAITDSVSGNIITGRRVFLQLKYPVITETRTITKVAEARRQLYVGGSLRGKVSAGNRAESVGVGLMYKDRRDRMYGIGAGVDIKGVVCYELSSWWKVRVGK